MATYKKIITAGVLIPGLFINARCFGQNAFLNGLNDYKQHLHVQLIQFSHKDSSIKKTLAKTDSIIIIPYCRYNGGYIFSPRADNKYNLLQLDTTFRSIAYYLYWSNRALYVIPNAREFSDSGFVQKGDYDSDYGEIPMVNFGQHYSQNLFNINMLARERLGIYTFGFIDNDEIKLIGSDFNERRKDFDYSEYENICDYLNHKYGSIEKYAEMAQTDEKIRSLDRLITTMEDCKKLMRASYRQWEVDFPMDTAHILSLFFNEMDSLISLRPSQLIMLKKKIIESIKEPGYTDFPNGEFTLMGGDITDIIYSALTREQYSQYQQRAGLLYGLWTRAYNKLEYFYLPNIQTITREEEKKMMKKIIFE